MIRVPSWFILSTLAGYLVWIYHKRNGKKYDKPLPPGPRGLPAFGYLHKISGNQQLHRTLHELRERYGSVCSFYLGPRLAVLLSDTDVIRDAFVTKARYFSSRPDWFFLTKHMVQEKGILWSRSWNQMRRFSLSALKDLGISSSAVEERVVEEVESLCAALETHCGSGEFDPQWCVRNASANVICSIIFGKRFEYDDSGFLNLMKRLNFYVKSNMMYSFPNFLPWTIIFWFLGNAREALEGKKFIHNFILSQVEGHKKNYDPENIRDFIDLFIQHEAKQDKQEDKITDAGILTAITEVFFAGTETVATTLLWFLLFISLHPEKQQRCREEIMKVVGSSRTVRKADVGSLPYLEASLTESMRIRPSASNTIPHMVEETIEFQGYTLPRGAMVIANFYSICQDPAIFPEPHRYKPERWLDEAGNRIKDGPHIMPFGVGRRSCIGEKLARLELFIQAVTILQRFELSVPDPSNPPSTEAISGITLLPQPYSLIFNKL